MTTLDTISVRDAEERAARATSPQELARLSETADATDDWFLHQAVKSRAKATGWNVAGQNAGLDDLPGKMHEEAVRIVKQHKIATQQLAKDVSAGRVTAAFAREQVGSSYVAELDKLVAQVEARVERAQSAYDAAVAGASHVSGSPTEQLLAEMRRSKVWERIQREYRPGKDDPVDYLTRRMSNLEERAAILDEGPSWLASQGRGNSGRSALTARLREIDPIVDRAYRGVEAAKTLRLVMDRNQHHLRPRLSNVAPTFAVEPEGTELRRGYTNPTTVRL